MDAIAPKTPAKTSIAVLHCKSDSCDALLAYEVDQDGFLYVDLAWTAREDDGVSYLPCPGCSGKNVIERARDAKGVSRPRVVRFLP